MTLVLSPKQRRYLTISNGRVNIAEGSVRSGKTIAQIIRWAGFLSHRPNTHGELLISGRTKDSIYRNVFRPIETDPLLAWLRPHVHYRQGAPTGTMLGHRVNVMGANTEQAAAVVKGMTVAGALLDEVTMLPRSYFREVLARMSVEGAQLFGTTNPDSPHHWLKVDYLDVATSLPGWVVDHWTLLDNPFLPQSYVASLSAEYTGVWYQRAVLGLWVAAQGAVYDSWNPAVHVIPWGSLPRMDVLIGVGVDYGTTNPSSAVLLGVGADGRLYAVDEWRVETKDGARMTDSQLSASFRSWLARPHLPHRDQENMPPRWIAVDPAAASFKVQLRADGLRNVIDADNDVLYGIRTVASLLSTQALQVTDRCTGVLKEVPVYLWDPKKSAEGKDVPIKDSDHSLDALRYGVATMEAMWRGRVTVAPPPKDKEDARA